MRTQSIGDSEYSRFILRDYLSWLFRQFDIARISYCVLRNYQQLPDSYPGSDIDILVASHQLHAVDKILCYSARHFDLMLLPIIRRSYVHNYRFTTSPRPNSFSLIIDIHINEEVYGLIYFRGDQLLRRRRLFNGFYIPDPLDEAIILWFSSYLAGGFIKSRYENTILRVMAANQEEFFARLSSILGERLSYKLIALSETPIGLGTTLSCRRRVLCTLALKSLQNYRFYQIRNSLHFFTREVALRLHPPGVLIVMIGPDGSGKSTVAASCFSLISPIFHSDKSQINHWRPGYLPPLRNLLRPSRWATDYQTPITNPHSSKPSGKFLSFLRLLYYLGDFTIGYWLKTRKLLEKNALVIFDRFYYDFLVDPLRSRINLPSWVPKLFLLFLPKPDATIYLDASPEILYSRKPELPLSELYRQVSAFRDILPTLPNPIIVNTERPLYEVVDEVSSAILTTLTSHKQKNYLYYRSYLFGSHIPETYFALPSRQNCRWLLPTDPILARKAWHLYNPLNLTGKIYKLIMHSVPPAILGRFFRPIERELPYSEEANQLKKCITKLFGKSDFSLAISTGTPGPFNKLTAVVITSKGEILAFVKVGESPQAIDRIRNEAKVLKYLEATGCEGESEVRFPRCLHHGPLGSAYCLIQSPAPHDAVPGESYWKKRHTIALSSLMRINITYKPALASQFWLDIERGVIRSPVPFRTQMLHAHHYLEQYICGTLITCCLSHGDFTPWNMLWQNDRMFLFDWESAVFDAPAGIDLVHFLFQTGLILKKYRGSELVSYILDKHRTFYEVLSSQTGSQILNPRLLLLVYCLYWAVVEDIQNPLTKPAVERRNIIATLSN